MPTARVNDVDIHYEVVGSGAPTVLIPGLGGDIRLLEPVSDALAPNCRVLALDPRGAGGSGRPDRPYSIETMAGDVARVMDAVDMLSAHIVGYSMGGCMALALALDHPERVRSVTLLCAAARTAPTIRARVRQLLSDLAGLAVARGGAGSDADVRRQRIALYRFDCAARLGEIDVPTLILHARDDEVVPFSAAVELHERIDGSRLESFPGGHAAILDRRAGNVMRLVDDHILAVEQR